MCWGSPSTWLVDPTHRSLGEPDRTAAVAELLPEAALDGSRRVWRSSLGPKRVCEASPPAGPAARAGGYAPARMQAPRTAAARVAGALRSADRLSVAVTVAGVLGALALLATEFTTIFSVDVLTSGTCEEIADPAARDACQTSGFEQHGGAFVLLGLLALVMALGAGRGRSRPAATALVAIGAVVLAFAVARDLPKANDTGLVGIRYEEARAGPRTGLYLEIGGGVLCVAAGALGLLTGRSVRKQAET